MSGDSSTISARKLRANCRNARNSTGPRTDSGKARSSRNAIAHGLFCQSLVLPQEDAEYFRDFQSDLLKSLNPRDAMELAFVQQIISAAQIKFRGQEVEGSNHSDPLAADGPRRTM